MQKFSQRDNIRSSISWSCRKVLQESDCFEDVDVEVFSSMSPKIFENLEFLFWTVFFSFFFCMVTILLYAGHQYKRYFLKGYKRGHPETP